MKKILACFIGVSLLVMLTLTGFNIVSASKYYDADYDFPKIDEYVLNEMKAAGIKGLSYGIIKDDKIVYMNGFGTAGPTGEPVTPQTPFQICSVGKTFTNLAAAKLINEGRMNLDDSVQKYIPWFQVADKTASSQIKIKDLTYHTSGISNLDGNKAYLLDNKYSLEDLVRMQKDTTLNRPVGTTYEYSNINYIILGCIIELVTGMSYNDYVEKEIFSPLDMKSSYTSEEEAKKNKMASGYGIMFGMTLPYSFEFPKNVVCEGWHISSVEDMCHFMIAYVNKGYYNGKPIISQDKSPNLISDFNYYDIHWQPQQGWPQNGMIDHGGASPNYESRMIIVPSESLGIIVISNTRTDILPLYVKSSQTIAVGIREMLNGQQPSTNKIPSIKKYYMKIDLLLLAVLLIMVFHIIMTLKWWRIKRANYRLSAKDIIIATIDIGLSVFITGFLPGLFSTKWNYLLLTMPDISWFVLITGIALGLLGILRAVSVTTWLAKDSVSKTAGGLDEEKHTKES